MNQPRERWLYWLQIEARDCRADNFLSLLCRGCDDLSAVRVCDRPEETVPPSRKSLTGRYAVAWLTPSTVASSGEISSIVDPCGVRRKNSRIASAIRRRASSQSCGATSSGKGSGISTGSPNSAYVMRSDYQIRCSKRAQIIKLKRMTKLLKYIESEFLYLSAA